MLNILNIRVSEFDNVIIIFIFKIRKNEINYLMGVLNNDALLNIYQKYD